MKTTKSSKTTAATKETNTQHEIILALVATLNNNKAESIVEIDMFPQYQFEQWFIVATGLSQPHLKKLAEEVFKTMKELGERPAHPPSVSDFESGWIVLDYYNIVVHLFTAEMRERYKLEELWKNIEVKSH